MGGDAVTRDPLRRFAAEHQEALAMLDRLERAALGLRTQDPPRAHLDDAREACDFLAGPVRTHNRNEELALFPLLGEDAPTPVFVEEHERLWALEAELTGALRHDDVSRVSSIALELVDLLRAHIAREDEVLFPLARERLGEAGLRRVAQMLGE